MFFDLLAVRLIGPRAEGKTIVLNAHSSGLPWQPFGYNIPALASIAGA